MTDKEYWKLRAVESDRVFEVFHKHFQESEFLDRNWNTCRTCFALTLDWEAHLLYHDPTQRPYFIDPRNYPCPK